MNHKPFEATLTVTVKYWLDDKPVTGNVIDDILKAIANDIRDGWITRNEIDQLSLRPIEENPWHDADSDFEETRLFMRGGGEF